MDISVDDVDNDDDHDDEENHDICDTGYQFHRSTVDIDDES
jgi:hypothetical protein